MEYRGIHYSKPFSFSLSLSVSNSSVSILWLLSLPFLKTAACCLLVACCLLHISLFRFRLLIMLAAVETGDVKLLAHPDIDVNVKDKHGQTPFFGLAMDAPPAFVRCSRIPGSK